MHNPAQTNMIFFIIKNDVLLELNLLYFQHLSCEITQNHAKQKKKRT